MKIMLIVAGADEQFCGVEDYSVCLEKVMHEVGYDVALEIIPAWSIGEVMRLRAEIKARGIDIVHVQYPSIAAKRSPFFALFPAFIGRSRLFVTLHEFSIFSLARKIYLLPYVLRRAQFVFSSSWERQKFEGFFAQTKVRSHIIPIGSNIPQADVQKPFQERQIGLAYFGFLIEGKGTDVFFAKLATLRQSGWHGRVLMMGATSDQSNGFFQSIERDAKRLQVELKLNLEPEEVARHLANTQFALLPFPDGISDKRGSALACLVNGVRVVAGYSDKTPDWMRQVVINLDSWSQVAQYLLGKDDPDVTWTASHGHSEVAWSNIANSHFEAYQSSLSRLSDTTISR